MKTFFFAVASLALAASSIVAGAAQPSSEKHIKAQGCVKPGAENDCVVVEDAASGKLYSLVIAGLKPSVGAGIDFSGTLFSGASACTQGTPVRVSNWTNNEALQCGKSKGKSVQ